MKNFGVCGTKGCAKSFENVERIIYFVELWTTPEETGGGVGSPPVLDPE